MLSGSCVKPTRMTSVVDWVGAGAVRVPPATPPDMADRAMAATKNAQAHFANFRLLRYTPNPLPLTGYA